MRNHLKTGSAALAVTALLAVALAAPAAARIECQGNFQITKYGPIDSGITLLTYQGGLTASDNQIRLRNKYSGLYVQDDWRPTSKLSINAGVRWDYDSAFPNKANISPRIGLARKNNRRYFAAYSLVLPVRSLAGKSHGICG